MRSGELGFRKAVDRGMGRISDLDRVWFGATMLLVVGEGLIGRCYASDRKELFYNSQK